MRTQWRLWWQKIKRCLFVAGIIAVSILVIVMIVGIIGGYLFNWTWTGLSQKTLWDWLQLLIIPAVLAVGGYLFNFAASRTEREIASDKQSEDALQAYIDKISELLLEKHLRQSQPEDEVRNIARVRTLTVLPRLDHGRKGSVLRFLYDSGLITSGKTIIDLGGVTLSSDESGRRNLESGRADLSGARLNYSFLRGANLGRVDLTGANLSRADLRGADLSFATLSRATLRGATIREADLGRADLDEADLSEADLKGANLSGADLEGANLAGANLTGAFLSAADLTRVNLTGANLSGAFLNKADLFSESHVRERPFVSRADLRGTDLHIGANLTGAFLNAADLTGADLTGARVTQQQWEKAKSLQGAIMPDGSKHS